MVTSLVEEIIGQSAYIEAGSVDEIEYVGLSYDAFIQVKKEVEDELDMVPKGHDIDNALTLRHFILPNLRGVSYEFFKRVTHA
jgi:hypothetical protein